MEIILGWIGNIGFLLGAVWLAHKKIIGFYSQILANLAYLIQSLLMNNYPLFWLSLILIFFNLYCIYQWNIK